MLLTEKHSEIREDIANAMSKLYSIPKVERMLEKVSTVTRNVILRRPLKTLEVYKYRFNNKSLVLFEQASYISQSHLNSFAF